MKVLIFSNGELTPGHWYKKIIEDCDLVIAADGGAKHALRLGLKVHHLIGDMDSISLEDFNVLKTSQCKVHFFPQDKDKTDLELALDLALENKADEVHILSGEGGRFDHQLGNVLLAGSMKYESVPIWFYSRLQRAAALHANKSRTLKTSAGSLMSVIPLSRTVQDFCIDAVQWPLDKVELQLGSTLTLSNRTTGPEVNIPFSSGTVLVILEDL